MNVSTRKEHDNFLKSLEEFREATEFTKPVKSTLLASQVDLLCMSQDGMAFLYEYASILENAGFFSNTAWNEPDKLVPSLVKGTLKVGHPTSSYEVISELRLMAYARKKEFSDKVTAVDAANFIDAVIVLNLEFALKEPTEESRQVMSERELKKAFHLFEFLLVNTELATIQDKLLEEIKLICAQRPIVTRKARELITLLSNKLKFDAATESGKELLFYIDAVTAPSRASKEHKTLEAYERFLKKATLNQLKEEADAFGLHMKATGLTSKHHALLLLKLVNENESLVPLCLHLNDTGKNEWKKYRTYFISLIKDIIHPFNSQCIYGLSRLLEKGLVSRRAVRVALENLQKIKIDPEVETRILKSIIQKHENVSALDYLIGATLRTLGQPLGVGQGNNPTCQSARGISMWSQHAPAKLINLIITAATQNNLVFRFENQELESKNLNKGLMDSLDYDLDAVSVVLVPHLDKIYNEMMKLASLRGDDPHRWVNPAMYGQWIQVGFLSAYDYLSNSIKDFEAFIRIFYASFHVKYNGQQQMVYPNPVGIFITSAKGDMVGFHALSLLRIAEDPKGEIRAYFLNPNNEGRQDWGQTIKPSVFGHGEKYGESSLPFYQFAARIYAFHYNNLEVNNWLSEVPESEIVKVTELAKSSWGRSYIWT